MDDMHTVVTNSTVDGFLAALFAVLIIVVLADATRVCIKAIRARRPLETTEVPHQPSRLVAPAGLFATAEERMLLAETVGGGTIAPGGRFERDADRERAGSP
jgi:carbon starvation protein